MLLRKLSKDVRERLRAQRRETQLITARARSNRSFVYVVNPPRIPRVAFGSCMERSTLPLSGPGLTSFMRKIQGEVREYPGPADNVVKIGLDKKYPSKVGYSAFASKLPRMPPTELSPVPPIGAYDIEPPKMPKAAARPFGTGVKLMAEPKFLTPGPPTYPYHLPRPQLNISTAFGGRRIIWPAVAILCTPLNVSKCSKCNHQPLGDYFHNFSANLDMCRRCMRQQQRVVKHCATDVFQRMRMKNELDQFRPVRYCGFFHDHQATTAAIQTMPTATLRHKIKCENYLYKYYKR